jgi:hypothetical protein
MPTFVFTYRAPKGYTRTAETGQAWWAWFDGMRDALVDLGKPVVARTGLGNCSADDTELSGYSVVTADDLEGAIAMAKGCPYLDRQGGIEVGELGEIPAPVAGIAARA